MGKIYDQLYISLLGNSSSWYLYRDWNFEHCNDRTSQVRLYLWMVIVLLILSKYIDWEPRIYKMCTCWVTLVVSKSLWPHGLQTARLLCPWGFPGKNTGVGSHSLLQGIFPTQGLNPGLTQCRRIFYCLSYQVISTPTVVNYSLLWILFFLKSLIPPPLNGGWLQLLLWLIACGGSNMILLKPCKECLMLFSWIKMPFSSHSLLGKLPLDLKTQYNVTFSTQPLKQNSSYLPQCPFSALSS